MCRWLLSVPGITNYTGGSMAAVQRRRDRDRLSSSFPVCFWQTRAPLKSSQWWKWSDKLCGSLACADLGCRALDPAATFASWSIFRYLPIRARCENCRATKYLFFFSLLPSSHVILFFFIFIPRSRREGAHESLERVGAFLILCGDEWPASRRLAPVESPLPLRSIGRTR